MDDEPDFPRLDPETEAAILADPKIRAALDASLAPHRLRRRSDG